MRIVHVDADEKAVVPFDICGIERESVGGVGQIFLILVQICF